MKIAIDASRTTVARVTGTERYALELIRELIVCNDAHTLHLYFRDQPGRLFPVSPHVEQHIIPFPRLWTHARFAAALWAHRPALTFVPAHTLPFAFPGRAAVTVHDLGYHYFPDAHPPRQRLYLDITTRYSAARASLILADSASTARDLTAVYGVKPDKIRVVYPGVTPPEIGDTVAVRAKYRLPERYWLFIGTLQPRKNIVTLVEAYKRWKKSRPREDTALVLAGGRGWLFNPEWTAGVEGLIETGYIDEADKGALLAGAQALLLPSLYEGFGFPVLEALYCGTPVICSDSSSLPELGGDVAHYVPIPPEVFRQRDAGQSLTDALDVTVEKMVELMDRLSDTPYSEAERQRGRAQAERFTWRAAAVQTLQAFTELAERHS